MRAFLLLLFVLVLELLDQVLWISFVFCVLYSPLARVVVLGPSFSEYFKTKNLRLIVVDFRGKDYCVWDVFHEYVSY